MKINRSWFSFVEIIITISILIIISIVAVTYMDWSKDKANNSKITSDIITLKNSLTSYKQVNSTLPNPSWNLKFYNIDGSYEHNLEDENTFWVSWYLWEWIFEKKFLDQIPLDPRTNQFYAYWKTKNYNWFQLAWILQNNYEPKSVLTSDWNWLIQDDKNYSPYLVREYNWPNFIVDNSIKNFPYNPIEKKLIATIQSFSWDLLINWKTYTRDEILSYTLKEWENLEISTGWTIDLYYSDGSYSMIWDASSNSKVSFDKMSYIQENSLLTSIKVALNMWSIWTKAVKLDDKSEFEIYTPNAVAAVRWTIFWVNYNSSKTNITVKEWKVQVKEIKNKELIPINNSSLGINNWVIEVKKWEAEKWIDIEILWWRLNISPSTWAINKIPFIKKQWLINQIKPNTIKQKSIASNLSVINKININQVIWTWSEVVDFYKEVLNRNPNKDELDLWVSNWEIESYKNNIIKNWYFNYLNSKEKYFNPDYICQAQNTFKYNDECLENNLFKDDINWKLYFYMPFDDDYKSYNIKGNSNIENWSGWLWHGHNECGESYSWLYNIYWCYKKEKNFYKITTKDLKVYNWITIDNYDTPDYLSYKFWSYTWSFSIEMNIRWWALKRIPSTSTWFYLFQIWGFDLKLYKNDNNQNNLWFIKNWPNEPNWVNIEQNDRWLNKLNDDTFYKVVAVCDDKYRISIYDWNTKVLESISWSGCFIDYNDDDLMIWYNWTWSVAKNQWNDLIDYAKVYTKDKDGE